MSRQLVPAGFIDAVLNRTWDVLTSMNKARHVGFHGRDSTVDTFEMYLALFAQLADDKIVPTLLVPPYRFVYHCV